MKQAPDSPQGASPTMTQGIMDMILSKGELHQAVVEELKKNISCWEYSITPEYLEKPAPGFVAIARFYQKAVALHEDGHLSGDSMFSYMRLTRAMSVDEKVSRKEIEETVCGEKWNRFSRASLLAEDWQKYMTSPRTIKGCIKNIEQIIHGVFDQCQALKVGKSPFLVRTGLDAKGQAAIVKQVEDIFPRLFQTHFGSLPVSDMDVRNGSRVYQARAPLGWSEKEFVAKLFTERFGKMVHPIMNRFLEGLDQDVVSMMDKRSDIASYNKYGGYDGLNSERRTGMFMGVLVRNFPWCRDIVGDIHPDTIKRVMETVRKMEDAGEHAKVMEMMYDFVRDSSANNLRVGKRVIRLYELAYQNRDGALESLYEYLKPMTPEVRKVAESIAGNLGVDVARRLKEEYGGESGNNGKAPDLLPKVTIGTYEQMMTIGSRLVDLGVTVPVHMPDTIAEVERFNSTRSTGKFRISEIDDNRLLLFAMSLNQNIVSPSGNNRNDAASVAGGDIFNSVYGQQGMNLVSMLETMRLNETYRGREAWSDVDYGAMKRIDGIKLPVQGLMEERLFHVGNESYVLSFPGTLADFRKAMTWEMPGRNRDGRRETQIVTGKLRSLMQVMGQRILSQATPLTASHRNRASIPFVVFRSESFGRMPLFYGEIDMRPLYEERKMLPSFICHDAMNTNRDEIEDVKRTISHMATDFTSRNSWKDILRARRDFAREALPLIQDEPLVTPYNPKKISRSKWMQGMKVYGEDQKEDMKRHYLGSGTSASETARARIVEQEKKQTGPEKELYREMFDTIHGKRQDYRKSLTVHPSGVEREVTS